jgi:dethiobiotin synthetase
MAQCVFVAGTGTDVGKTHVVCALLTAARARGLRAAAFKPIATGVDGSVGEDATRHADALGRAPIAPLYVYSRAVSPHLAAREEDRPISLAHIAEAVSQLGQDVDLLFVESAGGLFTPIGVVDDEVVTNATLARALAPTTLVVVAPDRIGVLHDVGATLVAGKACGLADPVVVLSVSSTLDASSGSNANELAALGIADVAAVFPRAAIDAEPTRAEADRLLDQLRRCESRLPP